MHAHTRYRSHLDIGPMSGRSSAAGAAAGKYAFVTVGTTQFEALATAMLSEPVLEILAAQGFQRLVLQLGRGPEPELPAAAPLQIDWYRFKPSLAEDMRGAGLIVSHAGAGSILEGMRLGSLMVVVVNDSLSAASLSSKKPILPMSFVVCLPSDVRRIPESPMRACTVDNHQQELADELHARQHLIATTPRALPDALRGLAGPQLSSLTPMPPADTAAFPAFLAASLGV